MCCQADWPAYDESKTVASTVDMAVQDFVQGKYFIIEPEEDAGQEDE